ncbi:ABC transporter substrate-binding protein [Sphingomonas sp. Leaf4]|uniref:ABC transporter substrate-binding protein n=1 Tax=Sphingomonas sp. Leaf4 TaxID=2876553 RepID=UPI001E5D4227|nr:ABC transporter substrate-binding protein [Sphingomonas sp. Leaf4]
MRCRILLPLFLMLSACDRGADDRPVVVSVVQEGRGGDAERAVLRGAVAQGLVRFDAAGQVEPAIAARWNMLDGGRSYIFRLGDATWSDGRPVTAGQVVQALRHAVRPDAGHRLSPFLRSIDEIVAMTPQVIEVRLKRPNTELLTLLAQPELAVIRGPHGSGPLRRLQRAGVWLRAPADPDAPPPVAADEIRLRGERGSRAIARFVEGRSDLVLGGGVADWPIVRAAAPTPADIRVDPARGLFGFAFAARSGFLSQPLGRAAVAMALQSGELPAAIDAGWGGATTVLPERLDSASDPALPPWRNLTTEQRWQTARAQVAGFAGPVSVRVALPDGPGATLLWGRTARALARIGIAARRVAIDAPADLRLIDQVAPYDSARWYLANACRPCSIEALTLIAGARDAATLEVRADRLAAADAALAADVAFVTLARPWRWSLVARRLGAFQTNARVVHPLNHLRRDPR